MIKLYLDEDVPEAVAIALKLRGYDVLTVRDALKKGLSDIDQLKSASLEEDFLPPTIAGKDAGDFPMLFLPIRTPQRGLFVTNKTDHLAFSCFVGAPWGMGG